LLLISGHDTILIMKFVFIVVFEVFEQFGHSKY